MATGAMAAPLELCGSTIDSSTSSAVVAEPDSSVEKNMSNTNEMTDHVGVFNRLDPYFYKEFIFKANVVWNTAQLPGTLLWYAKIHPDECNQGVAYLSKMYNCWSGSIDFKLKIGGTGLHAGSLVLVRLPPNIPPSSLSNPADVTVFPHAVADAKNLECISRDVMDQRQVLFHYRNDDPTQSTSFGGYYAIYVMLPLSTSSTAATSINCNIFSRAGASFRVAQPRPLSIVGKSPEDYTGFQNCFPQTMTGPLFNTQIMSLQINTNNTSSTNDMYGLVNIRGQFYSTERQWSVAYPKAPSNWYFNTITGTTACRLKYVGNYTTSNTYATVTQLKDLPLKVPTGTVKVAPINTDPSMIAYSGVIVSVVSRPANGYIKMYQTNAVDGGQDLTSNNGLTVGVNYKAAIPTTYPFMTQVKVAEDTDLVFPPQIFCPSPNEVLVMFVDSNNFFNMLTTETMILFRSQELFQFEPDQCVIFCYYDAANRPIRYFKLRYEGFMTTTTPTANVNLSLDPYSGGQLKVIGLGLASDPLPSQVGTTVYLAAQQNEQFLVKMADMDQKLTLLTQALGV